MNRERAVRKVRALAFGRYPSAAAAARTLATVGPLTLFEPLSAREAVLTDTPLRWATCRRSTANVCPLPGSPAKSLGAYPVRTFPQETASPHPYDAERDRQLPGRATPRAVRPLLAKCKRYY